MRRIILTLVVALVLVFSTVAPIHVTVPAGECAASDQAGDNPTAGAAIVFKNPAQDPPVGNAQGAANSQADC
jgi:hypothetical protein